LCPPIRTLAESSHSDHQSKRLLLRLRPPKYLDRLPDGGTSFGRDIAPAEGSSNTGLHPQYTKLANRPDRDACRPCPRPFAGRLEESARYPTPGIASPLCWVQCEGPWTIP